MTEDELRGLVTTHLDRDGDAERWSDKLGAVLYSDLASIRQGRFYLMGANPGSEGGSAIRETLCAPTGTNSYTDEYWGHSPSPCEHIDPSTGHLRPEAREPMQKRVCDLFKILGEAPSDVLSTNLVFARSPRFAQLPNLVEWVRRCWPVHQALLRIVQPEWIIMLGYGRHYDLFRAKGKEVGEREAIGPGTPAAWYQRMTFDIGEERPLSTEFLAVRHPSILGFSRAGFGNIAQYPDTLKTFVTEKIFGRPASNST